MKKPDNPPAFARPASEHVMSDGLIARILPQAGMTLRDWFAGMALQGMMAFNSHEGTAEEFALDAFSYADAMLAEREKSQ